MQCIDGFLALMRYINLRFTYLVTYEWLRCGWVFWKGPTIFLFTSYRVWGAL